MINKVKINISILFFINFWWTNIKRNKKRIEKKSWSFWVEMKNIISGHEIKNKKKFFFLENKIKKITKVKKLSCDPKLSDFNIDEKSNKISELVNRLNSKYFMISIFAKPFSNT